MGGFWDFTSVKDVSIDDWFWTPYLESVRTVMLPYVLLGGHLHGLAPAPSTLFLLLVVGIVHTGLVYILFFSAVGRLPAQTTAVLSYVDPVTAILLATLFLHQPFGLAEACGTVLILGATLANELPGKAPSHS